MEYITLKETADRLHITRKTLYKLRNEGELAFTKVGKATRIATEELERFLEAHTDRQSPGNICTGAL